MDLRKQRTVNSERKETNQVSPYDGPTYNIKCPGHVTRRGIQLDPTELAELRKQSWFSEENKATKFIENRENQ